MARLLLTAGLAPAAPTLASLAYRAPIGRLDVDGTPRRPCDLTWRGKTPSEATFSRSFAEFSDSALPVRLHEEPVKRTVGDCPDGRVSRVSIETREKPAMSLAMIPD